MWTWNDEGSLFDNFTWKENYLGNVLTRCSSPPPQDDWVRLEHLVESLTKYFVSYKRCYQNENLSSTFQNFSLCTIIASVDFGDYAQRIWWVIIKTAWRSERVSWMLILNVVTVTYQNANYLTTISKRVRCMWHLLAFQAHDSLH